MFVRSFLVDVFQTFAVVLHRYQLQHLLIIQHLRQPITQHRHLQTCQLLHQLIILPLHQQITLLLLLQILQLVQQEVQQIHHFLNQHVNQQTQLNHQLLLLPITQLQHLQMYVVVLKNCLHFDKDLNVEDFYFQIYLRSYQVCLLS